jgi:hypothetical protein
VRWYLRLNPRDMGPLSTVNVPDGTRTFMVRTPFGKMTVQDSDLSRNLTFLALCTIFWLHQYPAKQLHLKRGSCNGIQRAEGEVLGLETSYEFPGRALGRALTVTVALALFGSGRWQSRRICPYSCCAPSDARVDESGIKNLTW